MVIRSGMVKKPRVAGEKYQLRLSELTLDGVKEFVSHSRFIVVIRSGMVEENRK